MGSMFTEKQRKGGQLLEVYLVELFNRSVLDLGSEEGHDRLETAYATASEYNYALPRFNLDKVSLETSCIIKIPIPDQDWFVLSMEQKKVEDSEGDQGRVRRPQGKYSWLEEKEGSFVGCRLFSNSANFNRSNDICQASRPRLPEASI